MNDAESFLDEARTALSLNRIADAEETLGKTKISIDNASSLLVDVQAATKTLGGLLGVFSALAESPVKHAYDRLNENLIRVIQLTDELDKLRESLIKNPQEEIRIIQLIDELNKLRENNVANPQEEISVYFYYPTFIEISAPDTAYPGLPAVISGKITSTGDDVDRIINIFLDGTLLVEKTVPSNFSLEVTPPGHISSGQHTLIVTVLPRGPYAEASIRQTINIARLPIYLDTRIPSFVLLPKTILVSGRIYDKSGPIQNAGVTISLSDTLVPARTSPDGSFITPVKLSLGLSITGLQEMTIEIRPQEPWYTPLVIKQQFFALNPLLIIGLIAVVFITLFLLLKNRKRIPVYEEKAILQPGLAELSAITSAPESRPGLVGIKGGIISAYESALEVVESISGVIMAPHVTLREFPGMVTLSSPAVIGYFAELTAITEIALYSPREPPENALARAEKLAVTIKEELLNGTP